MKVEASFVTRGKRGGPLTPENSSIEKISRGGGLCPDQRSRRYFVISETAEAACRLGAPPWPAWPSVAQPEHAFLLSLHRALCQPFEGGLEEQQMVLLPHGVVRGARQIDKHLLGRAQIVIELPNAIGVDLFVMRACNYKDWDLCFPYDRCCLSPRRHLGRASDAVSPSRAHRV